MKRPSDQAHRPGQRASIRAWEGSPREGILAFIERHPHAGPHQRRLPAIRMIEEGIRHVQNRGGIDCPWIGIRLLASVLERTAKQRVPIGTPWCFQDWLRWSWRELDERVDRIAESLIATGVERGEHIGIWSMNVPEWVVAQFAAGRIGPCS